MKLNPYLGFDGECEAAFNFYEQCLGGKIVTGSKLVCVDAEDPYLVH
jgi:uncharacterized glyoxalase superfamily protein PhnB